MYGRGCGEQTCCQLHSKFPFDDRGLCRCTLFWGIWRMTGYAMTERWTMSFINQNRTLSRNRNISEPWIWTIKVGEYKARCNPTVPKLCYEIVMVRQNYEWSQRTNFKTWKSTHERIMIILTSSSRTKSNSCAAVQVKSAGSVVTVSLVPSQCSDTRVYTVHTKPMHLEDDQIV